MSTINLEKRRKFRGKFLGEISIDNIDSFIKRHGIADGTFKDIYVGDWFVVKITTDKERCIIFRLADLDIYEDMVNLGQHHICIVPDSILCWSCMYEYSDNWETHGYEQSYMNCATMPMINKAMGKVFGSHLLEYTELLSVDSNGAVEEYQVQGILMSEMEMLGKRKYSLPETDAIINKQLALFAEHPDFIKTDYWYNWLRDISKRWSSRSFVSCNADGSASLYGASDTRGVRPRFLLG